MSTELPSNPARVDHMADAINTFTAEQMRDGTVARYLLELSLMYVPPRYGSRFQRWYRSALTLIFAEGYKRQFAWEKQRRKKRP